MSRGGALEKDSPISPIVVLVVDDEINLVKMLKIFLEQQGYFARTATNTTDALKIITTQHIDLVLTDIALPDIGGISLLREIKKVNQDIEVVMMTGYASLATAVEAIRGGAYDYIAKPFHDLDGQVGRVLALALEKRALKLRNQRLATLLKISRALSTMMCLDELLETIINAAIAETGADGCSIMLRDLATDELYIHKAHGLDQRIINSTRIKLGEGIAGWVAQAADALLLQHDLQELPQFQGLSRQPDTQSAISLPLRFQNKVIGVLNVKRTKSPYDFTLADLQLLEIFADNAAVAIENARLFDTLNATIADLKKTKMKLRHSEKLLLLGELSAGLAHEIRNPLTGINLSLDILDSCLTAPPPLAQKHLALIHSEAGQINSIISRRLEFTRQREEVTTRVKINAVVAASLAMVEQKMLSQKITPVTNFADGLPEIMGDPHQLQQVFLNLFVNALQAMEQGGTLTVITAAGTGNDKTGVTVACTDTGHGIREEDVVKLFDPFFTTKAKGTGLGLAISATIIENHRGKIEVTSQLGKGTTIQVVLPGA